MQYKKFSTKYLGEVSVLNAYKEAVKLSSLWSERTAALVFVRHFG